MERTFTFKNGLTVTLKKMSRFMISRLTVDNTEKFAVPQQLVKVGTRGEEKLIPDYNNPTYNKLIDQQESKDLAETISNLSAFAVVDQVPDDEFDYYEGLAVETHGQDVSDSFIKTLWLFDQIDDENELSEFQQAILGLTTVTERGLEQSQEKFQHDNQQ